MVFNINNQNAAQINMAGGDQYNTGPQGTVIGSHDAYAAARALRVAVAQVALPPGVREQVWADAVAVERELAAGEPDRQQAAGRIERLTAALSRYGALATAGAALAGPLTTLGRWLGPAGAAVLNLLR
ncbi:hypothetical protein ACQPZX_12405 [Actinoplanes sp. CA-142083]|uniref:hypothetical protein n=1 Tax=Actinoplanes sp. CA-142083 TaxID=3239903 RepID=UPI003D91D6B5